MVMEVSMVSGDGWGICAGRDDDRLWESDVRVIEERSECWGSRYLI